jgi:hypothetical protein
MAEAKLSLTFLGHINSIWGNYKVTPYYLLEDIDFIYHFAFEVAERQKWRRNLDWGISPAHNTKNFRDKYICHTNMSFVRVRILTVQLVF